MGEKTGAFVKGGCGCVAIFAVLAVIALMLGGEAHANCGGILLLFVLGGCVGLIIFWIYDRGRKAGQG